jgi:hypothetical protein
MRCCSNRLRWCFAIVVLSAAADARIAIGVELEFAGRKWTVKESDTPVGPGPNRFSADTQDVWVDNQGLHLTIHKHGDYWYSTEVILNENLGYGTYLFHTTSRQDLLDDNAVFGAFTWDDHGDDARIPTYPNREIDFEDSRWGVADGPNSQIVVQPGNVPGNHFQFHLPDLSKEATLTRYFTWRPQTVDFVSLHGKYAPEAYPKAAVVHQHTYVQNEAKRNILPNPGKENFRFNLWLYQAPEPKVKEPVEVVIADFQFLPLKGVGD